MPERSDRSRVRRTVRGTERITASGSPRPSPRISGVLLARGLVAGALVTATGCGTGSDYKNQSRPAAPIVLGTSIDAKRISVSPSRFGAGPVVLVITNQSAAARSLTLQTDEIGGTQSGITQTTSPISPQGTAQLAAVLRAGRYRLGVDNPGVQPAELVVGPRRSSAQNQVLQP